MRKEEMIKVLCKEYGYAVQRIENMKYIQLQKLLSEERRERKECSENDDADLWPNGKDEE